MSAACCLLNTTCCLFFYRLRPPACYLYPTASYRLLAAGCLQCTPAPCCLLSAARSQLPATFYLLHAEWCLLLCSLLSVAFCLHFCNITLLPATLYLAGTCCLLSAVHCLLSAACCLPHAAFCLLFPTCCLLSAFYYRLLAFCSLRPAAARYCLRDVWCACYLL